MGTFFLSEIIGLSRKGVPQILINRANIVYSVIEKYPAIVPKIIVGINKIPSFELRSGKKVVSIDIVNPSWIEYRRGRQRKQSSLFNRKILNELCQWVTT